MIDRDRLIAGFETVHDFVWMAGYEQDIGWAMELADVKPDAHYVLSESAWVIVNSGFRYAVARKLWPGLRVAFRNFDPEQVVGGCKAVRREALVLLNYPKKIDAILKIAGLIALSDDGLQNIIADAQDPPKLTRLPFIGKITCWHLAKVLGVDCVKPDVHLTRAATMAGADSALELCEAIRDALGHRLTVIDTVLWRYGEQMQARGWPTWTEIWQGPS